MSYLEIEAGNTEINGDIFSRGTRRYDVEVSVYM
jgi:hypothetical protein